MTDIYHRFEFAEDEPEGRRRIVLTTIFRPEPWDYVLAIFGRRPWPRASEHETEFYSMFSAWFESSSDTRCSVAMCELLDFFYNTSYNKPGSRLIGRVKSTTPT